MATLNPLDPIAPWSLLPGMVCLDKDEFDTSGGGGAGDEDEDEDEDEGDEPEDKSKKSDEGDDEDEDDPAKNLDEGAKAVLRKERKAARQANTRAKKAEEELARLKAGKAPSGDEDKAREREQEAEARGAKAGQELAIRSSVRAELIAAGLAVGDDKAKALKRAMRLIDLDDLSIDKDGSIDGLEDAIAELKEDMPGLFARSKKRRPINGGDERSDDRKPPVKTATERQAEALAKKK